LAASGLITLFPVRGVLAMFTIGQLAKKFGLSRSTLLYYDSVGLLKPSGRSESNYRLYSRDDIDRMERIRLFRSTGLPLEDIAVLLGKQGSELTTALERRLFDINHEIQLLRNQQKVILKLLEVEDFEPSTRVITKKTWVSLLEAAGLDEEGMKNWHIEFEKTSPEGHQDFLESIGIEASEIARIREWSRKDIF
jgi:DNA-binding transcriptional MerR regulator